MINVGTKVNYQGKEWYVWVISGNRLSLERFNGKGKSVKCRADRKDVVEVVGE